MSRHEEWERELPRWRTPAGRWLASRATRLAGFLSAQAVPLILVAIGLAVAVPLVIASGEIYEAVQQRDELFLLDQPILQAAVDSRTAASARYITWFTDLGGPVLMPIIAAVATLVVARLRRSWIPLAVMVTAIAGSLLFTVLGKDLIGRARPPRSLAVPPYESSPSFPSGHTLNSTVIAGGLVYVALPLIRSLAARIIAVGSALAWAGSMGLSRVWLGHHWFTDVAVAWTLGLAWLTVVITAHRLYLTVRYGSWRTPPLTARGDRSATPPSGPPTG